MKKTIFLLLVPFFFVNTAFILMGGCFSKGPDYCGFYNDGRIIAFDNSDTISHLVAEPGVPARALSLKLALFDTLYKCTSVQPLFHGSSAYAFKRSLNVKEHTRIDSIQISSNHDFDVAHPAGTNLIRLFSNPLLNAGIQSVESDSATYYLLFSPADTGTHIFTIQTFTADPNKNATIISAPIKILL